MTALPRAGQWMWMVPLNRDPAAHLEPLAPAAYGLDGCAEYPLEEIKHTLVAEPECWLVVRQIGLAHILKIFGVVLVQLHHFRHERLIIGKVRPVEKAARVELVLDGGVAPEDRQTPRLHCLMDLFGDVARRA